MGEGGPTRSSGGMDEPEKKGVSRRWDYIDRAGDHNKLSQEKRVTLHGRDRKCFSRSGSRAIRDLK